MNFYKQEHHKIDQSYNIEIHENISFECILIPNSTETAMLRIEAQSKTRDISEISVYFETGFEETKPSMYKDTVDMYFDDDLGSELNLHEQEVAALANCKDKDKLTLFIKIEILKIKQNNYNKYVCFSSSIWNNLFK